MLIGIVIILILFGIGWKFRKNSRKIEEESQQIAEAYRHPGFVLVYAYDLPQAMRFMQWDERRSGREKKYYLYCHSPDQMRGYKEPSIVAFVGDWDMNKPKHLVQRIREELEYTSLLTERYVENNNGFVHFPGVVI